MNMQVEFLTKSSDIIREWDALSPLFQSVISRAAHGEFTVDDLHALAIGGKIQVGLVRQAGSIILALAFEFKSYPQKLAINFLAIGGKKLDSVIARFSETFQKWAQDAGVDWIEAFCSPAMARILARYQYITTYQLVRLDLKPKGEAP